MRLGRPTVSLSAGTGHGDFEDLDSERLSTCRSWVRVATLRCAEPCIEKESQVSARCSPGYTPTRHLPRDRWSAVAIRGPSCSDGGEGLSPTRPGRLRAPGGLEVCFITVAFDRSPE